MYLQITEKCNMTCEHCCFKCTIRKKHGKYETIKDSIYFISKYDDNAITIGGGEPTLHPQFFKILKKCIENFDYIWIATNGSMTKKMYRLIDIIEQSDNEIFLKSREQLHIALSLDYYHSNINENIEGYWKEQSKNNIFNYNNNHNYSIHNVTKNEYGVIPEGRAKNNRYVYAERKNSCVCNDLFIKPDGKIKLCGCKNSPVIGNVYNGIEEKWQDIIYNDDSYNDYKCYKYISDKSIRKKLKLSVKINKEKRYTWYF